MSPTLPSHALLVLPSANRVYAGTAPELAVAELDALDQLALGGRLGPAATEYLGGVPYVTFGAAPTVDDEALAVVSNLSAAYALFRRDGETLVPLPLHRLARWDDDLVTIQRYAGKTNEQFTRLLLNLTVAATSGSRAFTGTRVRVLDPLCGRGTTLNQAVLYGFDAAGIDSDRAAVDAYTSFFTTWLKDKRAKHARERANVRREAKVVGARTTLRFARDKEEQRAGGGQEVVVVADDTTEVVAHFGRSAFDAVVSDLPYGVQHGSRSSDRLRRDPGTLLAAALPAWRRVLRPGGAIGLSWNTRVLPRPDAAAMFEEAGLTVVAGDPMDRFAHRVDQAIERDLIVARRPEKT